MHVKLGLRLQQVAAFVPAGARLADIGSDHGYLAAWLLQNEKIASAIAGELNREPAERALQTAVAAGLQEQMQVRQGTGLTVLQPGEVDTVVIAGMGGSTIVEILESNAAVLPDLHCLVLQPNVAPAQVRHWLAQNGWSIKAEALVMENRVLYEVILAEPGAMESLNWLEAEIGPVLLRQRPPYLSEHLERAIEKRRHAAEQLLRSPSAAAGVKRQQLLQQIQELAALL